MIPKLFNVFLFAVMIMMQIGFLMMVVHSEKIGPPRTSFQDVLFGIASVLLFTLAAGFHVSSAFLALKIGLSADYAFAFVMSLVFIGLAALNLGAAKRLNREGSGYAQGEGMGLAMRGGGSSCAPA